MPDSLPRKHKHKEMTRKPGFEKELHKEIETFKRNDVKYLSVYCKYFLLVLVHKETVLAYGRI